MGMRGILRAGLAAGVGLASSSPSVLAAGSGITTNTTSFTERISLNPATISTTSTTTSWQTQILGKFNGGTLYDQTFNVPYANPSVTAGKAAAVTAITTAGGPGVVIGSPMLTSTSQTLTGSSTVTTYSLADTSVTVQVDETTGPGTDQIGQRTLCSGIGGLPSATAPTCGVGSPTTFVVQNGDANINVNTDTLYTIDQATEIDNSYRLFEQYTISGTVQALGLVHGAVPSLVSDNGERFARRLLDEAITGEGMGWADGFGWTGSGNGESRNGVGLDGGAGFNADDQWRVGFGVSQGWTSSDLDDAGGSASGTLTQLGLYLRWHDHHGAYLAGTVVGGFGSTDTSSTISGSTMTANYSSALMSLAGEAGYEADMGGWTLTPNIGGQLQAVSMGSFTETGAFALASTGSSSTFGKGWAGLKAERRFDAVTLTGYGRLAVYSDAADVPVGFAGGGPAMSVPGSRRGNIGLEAGLSAAVELAPNVHAFAAYDFTLRGETTSHAAKVGLKVSW